MKLSDKVLLKVYGAALGAAATVATQKLLAFGWEFVTGEEPPEPGDPDTPLHLAVTWALASAVGVGVVQLMTNRFTARRFRANFADTEPNPGHIRLKI